MTDGAHTGASDAGVPDIPSEQVIFITGGGTSFTISVTFGVSVPLPGVQTKTTASIPYTSGGGSANATAIQNALNASGVLGAGGATVTYDSTANWYLVQFAIGFGAPVMTASGTSLSITITVLQSGAAIVVQNAFGLQLVGDGSAEADYDQHLPTGSPAASRSALVWSGIPNGILLHLMGCNSTLVQDLALWGRTGSASQTGRTGLLLSPNLMNATGQQGGSGLTARSCVFTRFTSPLPSSAGSPNVSGCVQLGMNENDAACDTTSYEACTFANSTTGLLVVGQNSFNHYMHSCVMGALSIGAWFQQGGNFQCDGLRAEAILSSNATAFPPAVLKIGSGEESPTYPFYGGGVNASTFILNNVRTDPASPTNPNIPVVDARYAAPGTQVTVNGWDDTAANSGDTTTAAFILGGGVSLNVFHSLVARPVLAVEPSSNAPTPTTPTTLRMEDLIVPEHTLAAALCQGLTANTKVNLIGERTSMYNIVRPDVSTLIGRPRFSPVNWLIEQQSPKYFYDLGDIGLVAPNQGWNLYIHANPPRTDGQYVLPMAQNVQGIVVTDGIGGMNTQGTGYVKLLNPPLSFGQISGQSWTLFVIVKRNATGGQPPIVSNLNATPNNGGFSLYFDDTNSGKINFLTDNGSTRYHLISNTTTSSSSPVLYLMIQVVPNSALSLYVNGSFDNSLSLTGVTNTYSDNSIVPVIGATPGSTPTPSNLQIARLATFDLAVPVSAYTAIFNAGTTFQGR